MRETLPEPDEPDTKESLLGVSFIYSSPSHYRTPRDGRVVSGWAVAVIAGGLLGLLILVLLAFIAKAVKRTTENAAALVGALEEVRSKTIVLEELEAQSRHASDVVAEAAAVLRESRPPKPEDGDGQERS